MLSLKFDEQSFISNFISHKTDNEFVLRIFKLTDSIAQKQRNENYINTLESVLKQQTNLTQEEKNSLSLSQKKQYDSLSAEFKGGNFIKLFKSAVQVNFGENFLNETFQNSGIKNYKINQTDYNQFSISFSDKKDLEKAKTLFLSNQLYFHESMNINELEFLQNCFMKENDILVKNNYLKKENDHLLIYKDDAILFGDSYKNSKCFDSKKITYLLYYGEGYDVFSKLFFVKEATSIENSLVNSIKGMDISFKENRNDYTDNYFYLSIYLDSIAKKILSEFSEKNMGKKIYVANKSEFVSIFNITKKFDGEIFVSGNLFRENWQRLYELVKFEVFKNSLTISQ